MLRCSLDHDRKLLSLQLVVFKREFATVDEINNGSNEADSCSKKIEQSHADLIYEEALNPRNTDKADKCRQQNCLRVLPSCPVHHGKLLSLLIRVIFQKALYEY